MKIRMLVDGHTTQTYSLERGTSILQELEKNNMIVDDETMQLTKIEFLNEESTVTVYPTIVGG